LASTPYLTWCGTRTDLSTLPGPGAVSSWGRIRGVSCPR